MADQLIASDHVIVDSRRIRELEGIARRLRLAIVKTAFEAGSERRGHPGPALSIADFLAALYFEVMRVDPKTPDLRERDRLIVSKGHASIGLYAALAERGYFPKEELSTFRRLNSRLQGHPAMNKTPGVDMTSGSLGHGVAAGVGMALAGRLDKRGYRVFVIVGDGELDEGLVWEAAMMACKYQLDNLVVIADLNRFQSCGPVSEIMPLGDLHAKWTSFGWDVLSCDGNNMAEVVKCLDADPVKGKPRVILASTVKGKGVSYMENDNSWHQAAPTEEQWEAARRELLGQMHDLA